MTLQHIILGTAGHIDHGKSALVKALTGVDPDRLPEEQQRQITIDLGFAFLGESLAFVDVPGHEKFIRNMVAGASGIDCVMLVIAADDGIMPQTQEHLDILQLLGIKLGLVAITKTDLVDEDWLRLVQDDIQAFLRGTFLECAPVFPVSIVTGDGLPALKTYIHSLEKHCSTHDPRLPFRMPVDRVFTMPGFGTIVTGSVISGMLTSGDPLELLPSGQVVRIRNIQSRGVNVSAVQAGERAAVNIPGIHRTAIRRGDVLAHAEIFKATSLLDVHLQLLKTARTALKERERIRLHLGTHEVMARVHLYEEGEFLPGAAAFARLRLEAPTVAAPGDPFVIRRYSPQSTIGGGMVCDPCPLNWKRRRGDAVRYFTAILKADAEHRLLNRCLHAGCKGVAESEALQTLALHAEAALSLLRTLTGNGTLVSISDGGTDYYLHADAWNILKLEALTLVRHFHGDHPAEPGMPRTGLEERIALLSTAGIAQAFITQLCKSGLLEDQNGRLTLPGHTTQYSAAQSRLMEMVQVHLETARFQPPETADIAGLVSAGFPEIEQALRYLVQEDRAVRLEGGVHVAASAIRQAESLLRAAVPAGRAFSVSEFRALLGTSRKFALPILQYFDKLGITRRTGDNRVLVAAT